MLAGQAAMTGASLSLMLTLKVQALVLPLPSVAVQVTTVAPLAKAVPLAGKQTTEALVQLSLAVGAVKVATAVHWPASVLFTMLAGQAAMTGASLSLTITLKVQALVLPLPSVAVQVTTVAPFAKAVPLAGKQTTEALPQLSLAVGAVKVVTAVHWPASVFFTMLAGQAAMTGASLSLTVTLKVQALVLPLPSVAVQVTTVAPFAKAVPLAGKQTTEALPQLSLAVGAVKVVTAVHWPASVFFTMLAGQAAMTGASLSLTVTLKVQALVLPLPSVAVQVTTVAPFAKAVPLAGMQTTEALPQLSLAVGAVKVATAVHWPASVFFTMLAGQAAMTGASLSLTVTLKVQALVLPLPSVAVQVTTVVPLAKAVPLAGKQRTDALVQLSLAVGVVNVATAVHRPASVLFTMLAGHAAMTGAW